MLKKTEKERIVEELSNRFKRNKIAIFSDFHGISVSKAQALRRLLRKSNAEFKVAKKTLLDRSLTQAGIPLKTKELQGEIGVAFGYGDEAAPAKILSKFSKENKTLKILSGILGNQILNSGEILDLAKLPNREVLITKLVHTLQSPIQRLVILLQGNMLNLVVVLNKIKDNK